ncbi:MAG: LysR family transcriptional regulator [Anaerolineaceae bacterium]|nr:LysR family transcriptional regulator [Anaerolineaceae bacterium]
MLDAHQLNVFLTAARTLNFTAAARQLHMTQPSVSQHIQALEQHFGLQLFVRSGRHLRLTDAGEALLPMAQEMVSVSQSIDNKMESLKGDVYGRLVVGCSTTVGKYVLPFLLASFMQQHPKVEASCYVTPRKIAVQMLCDGEVHVALASAQELNPNLQFCKFITDRVSLIVPLNHPWAKRQWVEPEELLDVNFIWREEGSGTRYVAEEKLREHGIGFNQLKTILTLGNSEAIALAVQEGIGVGFVSQIIIARLVEGKVAPVKVRGLDIEQEIYIGRDANRLGTTAQTAFWEFVTDPKNSVLDKLMQSSKNNEDEFAFTGVALNGAPAG